MNVNNNNNNLEQCSLLPLLRNGSCSLTELCVFCIHMKPLTEGSNVYVVSVMNSDQTVICLIRLLKKVRVYSCF